MALRASVGLALLLPRLLMASPATSWEGQWHGVADNGSVSVPFHFEIVRWH